MRFNKNRLIFTVISLWAVGSIMLIVLNAGVGIKSMSGQMYSYNTITTAQMKRDLPVTGELYAVYGCVGQEYTENDNHGVKSITNKQNYYAVPFSDNSVLLIKTRDNSALDLQINTLYDACYNDETNPILTTGVEINGVLKPTDREIEQYTKEAFEEAYITGIDVEPYTLDCTRTISSYIKGFWSGVGLLAAFIIASVFFVMKTLSSRHSHQYASVSSSSPVRSYNSGGTYPSSSNSKYNPDEVFSSASRVSQDTYSSSAQTFRSQSQQSTQPSSSGSSFQSQQGYQPGNRYTSSSSTYQTQSNQTYGTSYRSQRSDPFENSFSDDFFSGNINNE